MASTHKTARLIITVALCVAPLSDSIDHVHAQRVLHRKVAPLGDDLGIAASKEEIEIWLEIESAKSIKARELAQKHLKKHPKSFIAHLALGIVHQYAEGDFPRALYHLNLALQHYEARFGPTPPPSAPWRWHAEIVRELAEVYGNLEQFGRKLELIARFNKLYEPDMIAERAWPLMKLGRYKEARAAAEAGLIGNDPKQVSRALNALCAIEFEAGHDGASYDACKRALEHAKAERGIVTDVDLTNLAEAARSLFRLDEAEQLLLEATKARVASYGNPWTELAELYTREARLAEALHALKEVPAYKERRPPHIRESDRNEIRRAVASFFLVINRADDAQNITGKALLAPDRRGHNSRDPAQDITAIALLDRRARFLQATLIDEAASTKVWYKRTPDIVRSLWRRWQAWTSGLEATKLLAERRRLTGLFRVGTAKSAVMQTWLVGDAIELVGPAVALAELARSSKEDERQEIGGYYSAFAADAWWRKGRCDQALLMGNRSLERLPRAEALLRARVSAIAAECAWQEGQHKQAFGFYEDALQHDPGIFRRLNLSLPVSIRTHVSSNKVQALASMLARSPRFDDDPAGMPLVINAKEVCLYSRKGTMMGCSASVDFAHKRKTLSSSQWAKQFHDEIFAPRVNLTQADANSLDGSNRTVRNPLEQLLGPAGTER